MVLGSGGSIRHGATLSKGIDTVLLGHSSKPDNLGGPLLLPCVAVCHDIVTRIMLITAPHPELPEP